MLTMLLFGDPVSGSILKADDKRGADIPRDSEEDIMVSILWERAVGGVYDGPLAYQVLLGDIIQLS